MKKLLVYSIIIIILSSCSNTKKNCLSSENQSFVNDSLDTVIEKPEIEIIRNIRENSELYQIEYDKVVTNNDELNFKINQPIIDQVKDFKDQASAPVFDQANYLYINVNTIQSSNDYIFNIIYDIEIYEGGIHPHTAKNCIMINFNNNSILTLNDVFADGIENRLRQLILNRFRRMNKKNESDYQYDLQYIDSQLTNEYLQNHLQFAITKKYLMIFLSEYELGIPSFKGSQILHFSITNVKDLLILNHSYSVSTNQ